MVYSIRKFRKYLYGRNFTVLTDSIPVTLIFGEKKAITSSAHPRLVRWSLFLSGYSCKIVCNKKAQVADCLSRLPSEVTTGDADISQLYVINVRTDAQQLLEIQKLNRT